MLHYDNTTIALYKYTNVIEVIYYPIHVSTVMKFFIHLNRWRSIGHEKCDSNLNHELLVDNG